MTPKTVTFLTIILLSSSTLLAQQTLDENPRSIIFSEADNARQVAVEAEAEAYSPKTFERAEKMYADASRDMDKNRKLDRIKTKLSKAAGTYRSATQTATGFKSELAAMLKSRVDAGSVDAQNHDRDNWRQAQKNHQEAIGLFERNRHEAARKRAFESESLFRAAELNAIKASYLTEARRLLSEAKSIRADRFAPSTFQKTRNLVQEAELELTANRYDADRPRDLARQAEYEARHTIFIARKVEEAINDKTDLEYFVLAGERPLQQISAEIDLSVGFDTGYGPAAEAIITHINTQQDQLRSIRQEAFERDQQIETLEEQLAVLETRYGSAATQRNVLKQQLDEQKRKRERFRFVESLFSEEQADVFRKGDDIILRLIGNTFEVSKARIEPGSYETLSRVIQAITEYPNSSFRIEGHTDSYGGDGINMELSLARATAVRSYLTANSTIDEFAIEAYGFGETRPIANNETKEGRERNRRIDIVITPTTSP